MIPKIIHYCWLSDDPIPANLQKNIYGWKRIMPDYEIIKWDRRRINLNEHPFAKMAFEDKRYAFAADYIRAYALYTMGGIYLDTDVEVYKCFDNYLDCSYFTSFETHLTPFQHRLLFGRYIDKDGYRYADIKKVPDVGLQAAILGSEKGSSLISDIYDFYKNLSYMRMGKPFCVTAPTIHSRFAEKYGFRYVDKYQELVDGIKVYPSQVFSSIENFDRQKAVALHACQGSWITNKGLWKSVLKKMPFVRDLYIVFKLLRSVESMKENIPEGL